MRIGATSTTAAKIVNSRRDQVSAEAGLKPRLHDTAAGLKPRLHNTAAGLKPRLHNSGARSAASHSAATVVAHAAETTITKAVNADALNLGSSWSGGIAPGAAEIALWDNTVSTANATVLGGDLSWAGIRVADPGGPVDIGAGNLLTLGSAGIDMSLHLVERLAGRDLALRTARQMDFAWTTHLTSPSA